LIAALIGLFLLGGYSACTRVIAIPWLVRKMRSMSQDLAKRKTPRLSGPDSRCIATRPDQLSSVLTQLTMALQSPSSPAPWPAPVAFAERDAEDRAIWAELDNLEGLGRDQKLDFFKHMKCIPPQDRVWFLEDLKKQMAASPPAPDALRHPRRLPSLLTMPHHAPT
jgi:hypothetical protein